MSSKFKPGQSIEVLRDMQRAWEPATYVAPARNIGRSFHRVTLANAKRIDSMSGLDCGPENPRGYLSALDFLPAARIRMPRASIETGTVYVNGHCLGPAERDAATGNTEQGPHVTARAARNADIAVTRVDQSPMNRQRWTVGLACGHEVWVTAKRKPTRKTAACPKCMKDE